MPVLPAANIVTHQTVDQRVKPRPLGIVAEDILPYAAPVQPPAGIVDVLAPAVLKLPAYMLRFLHQTSRLKVAVIDRTATNTEYPRHNALAGADASGQSDQPTHLRTNVYSTLSAITVGVMTPSGTCPISTGSLLPVVLRV